MRWYQPKLPQKGDCVVVKCTSSNDIGVYCQLLEYDTVEGFLPASEATKQRIRKVSQIIPIGRIFVASVISVDPIAHYIDLSKKHISREEIEETETRYLRAKKLHSILSYLSTKLSTDWTVEKIYDLAWSIHPTPTMTHLKEILERLPKTDHTEKIRNHYLSPKEYEIHAEVEVTCFSSYGIEGIRDSLLAAKKQYAQSKLSIRLLASPRYLLQLLSSEEEKGIVMLDEAIVYIGVELRKRGGEIHVEKEPMVVHSEDKAELEFRLKRLEAEAEEISGDDDTDE